MLRPALAITALIGLTAIPSVLARTVRQITDFRTDRLGEYALDDAGDVVVAVTSADPFGENPYHEYQAVLWTGTGDGSALTRFGGLRTTVSISDDGQWIAFSSLADPLGEGGSAFFRSADGSVLRQLPANGSPLRISGSGNRVLVGGTLVDVATDTATPLGVSGDSVSITDDGEVVVFSTAGAVYRKQADGSGLQQLTPLDTDDAAGAMVSGDGQRVVYESGGMIWVIESTGGGALSIGPGQHPSITDDHGWVYYSAMDEDNLEIWRAQVEPVILQRVTRTAPPVSNDRPLVSGDGTRVAFVRHGADGARTLMRMNGDGSGVEPLGAPESAWRSWDAEITPDGTRVVFVGGPPDRYDVFRVQADGSDLAQLTQGAEAWHPSVSEDGETIVFQSSLDLTGDNPCGTAQVFRIAADGSGLTQLSPPDDCAAREYPVLSREGRTVVYQEDGTALLAVSAGGGVPVLVSMDSSTHPKLPRLSRDGSLVVYESISSSGYVQAFLARTDGTWVTQISAYPLWYTERPDISANGIRVAYSEWGLAHNYYYQDLWLYQPETQARGPLTEYFNASDTRISGDGELVYFLDSAVRLGRMHLSTGQMETFDGLGFSDPRAGAAFARATPGNDTAYQVDHTGRFVVSRPVNWTGENPDLNQEIWIVDPEAAPGWDIETTEPARIRFMPVPQALHYDLIRGDLQNLSPGADVTVQLGEVVCLIDSAPTTWAVDPEGPAPDRGFFYLYRDSGESDWGSSSAGAPRVAAGGSCP